MNLKGKTAIVTGAARGIGAACARAFATHGASVVLADINEEGCQSTASEIESATGADTLSVPTDVADRAQCEALVARCRERFGRCDILLNNAGIIQAGSILDVSVEDFDRVLSVNLRGTFLLSQVVARHMVEGGIPGAIINRYHH